MIRNIPKPELSPNFTIDDIHKIREWNYERLKESTPDERRAESERKMRDYVNRLDLVFDIKRNCYVHYPNKQGDFTAKKQLRPPMFDEEYDEKMAEIEAEAIAAGTW